MKTTLALAGLLIAATAWSGPASATVMTFDGITATPRIHSATYSEGGYTLTLVGGSDPHYADPDDAFSGIAGTYGWHTASGNGNDGLLTLTKQGGGNFTLTSFDLAGYFGNNLAVSASGYGPSVFSSTGTYALNFVDVSSVTFDIVSPNDCCYGVAIDNLTIGNVAHEQIIDPPHTETVPEPSTLATFALSLTGLGLVMRRRRRKTA